MDAQQHFTRVTDVHMHLRILQRHVIHRSAVRSDLEDRRFQFEHVHVFDRWNSSKPPRRAAGPQADNQSPRRSRMQNCSNHTGHDLSVRVALKRAIAPAVDHKVKTALFRQGHAAFQAVYIPQNIPANGVHKVVKIVFGSGELGNTAHSDFAVSPKRSRPGGAQQAKRENRGPKRRQWPDEIPASNKVDKRGGYTQSAQ
jgi:hypothetical protein